MKLAPQYIKLLKNDIKLLTVTLWCLLIQPFKIYELFDFISFKFKVMISINALTFPLLFANVILVLNLYHKKKIVKPIWGQDTSHIPLGSKSSYIIG